MIADTIFIYNKDFTPEELDRKFIGPAVKEAYEKFKELEKPKIRATKSR